MILLVSNMLGFITRLRLCRGSPSDVLLNLVHLPTPVGSTYFIAPDGSFFGTDMEFESMIADYGAGRPVVLRPITLPPLPDRAHDPPVRLGYSEIELHYHSLVADIRPRVNVEFLGQGGEPVTYSMLLDTGSHRTYILSSDHTSTGKTVTERKVGGASRQRRGYLYDKESGREAMNASSISFGSGVAAQIVESTRQVREIVELVGEKDRFSCFAEIDLVKNVEDLYVYPGLLGVSRWSHFAEAAGTFTYLPPALGGGAGKLLIGERNEAIIASRCDGPVQWFPNLAELTWVHWSLAGSITVAGEQETTNWVIDTGAEDIYVPRLSYNRLVGQLAAIGAVVHQIRPRWHSFVRNCKDYKTRFPTFSINFGADNDGDDVLGITITPEDYIVKAWLGERFCLLRIITTSIDGEPASGLRLIGVATLRKLVSVFDREHDRTGFCKVAQQIN